MGKVIWQSLKTEWLPNCCSIRGTQTKYTLKMIHFRVVTVTLLHVKAHPTISFIILIEQHVPSCFIQYSAYSVFSHILFFSLQMFYIKNTVFVLMMPMNIIKSMDKPKRQLSCKIFTGRWTSDDAIPAWCPKREDSTENACSKWVCQKGGGD